MLDYTNNLTLPILKTISPYEVILGVKYNDIEIKNKMIEAKKIRLIQNQFVRCSITKLENENKYCGKSA